MISCLIEAWESHGLGLPRADNSSALEPGGCLCSRAGECHPTSKVVAGLQVDWP